MDIFLNILLGIIFMVVMAGVVTGLWIMWDRLFMLINYISEHLTGRKRDVFDWIVLSVVILLGLGFLYEVGESVETAIHSEEHQHSE